MRRSLALLAAASLAACMPLPPIAEPEPPAPVVEALPPTVPLRDPEPEPEPQPAPLPRPAEPAPPDEAKQVAELVAQAQRFATMSPDEQRRDYNAASQALLRERSLSHRIRLALLLSTPGSAVQDDARALVLLEGAPGSAGAMKQFAAFLHLQVAERVRGARRADQLKEQLDALRAVERSIIDRGSAGTPRKP